MSEQDIFKRLNQALTQATPTPPEVIRIPRADKKPPAEQQSKVVRLKMRPATHVQPDSTGQPVEVGSEPECEPGSTVQPQEPVYISSSMLPLIDRTEQQVNKATGNLMARVEQILSKLEEDAVALEKSGHSKQEKDEAAFSLLCDSIAGSLDHAAEDARSKVLDASATGQRTIQNVLETGNNTIDHQCKESLDSLLKRSKTFRIEQGELTQTAQKKFNLLVKQRANDVHALVELVKEDWEKLTGAELQGIKERSERAHELVSKEAESINSTFDQYCQSLERDINETWEQASYELNSTQKQYVAAADETLKIWQQRLALLTKSVIDSDIVPRLKELRDKLDNQVDELRQQFLARYDLDRSLQMEEVEAETNELKRRFRLAAAEAESSIYETITEQQTKILQLFINHRNEIRAALHNTEDDFESMHAQIKKSDAACRKLLISSAATLGLSLAADREKLISDLQELQKTTLQSMEDRLHKDTAALEEIGKREQSNLTDCSQKNIHLIREKCRSAIAGIQAQVEESFQEIQKAQEKFLL